LPEKSSLHLVTTKSSKLSEIKHLFLEGHVIIFVSTVQGTGAGMKTFKHNLSLAVASYCCSQDSALDV
jgi:hypothetical protein